MKTITHKGLTLHHIKNPSREDIEVLKKSVTLTPSVSQQLLSPSFHPKIETFEDNIIATFRFPFFDDTKQEVSIHELDFVINKDQLIIIQYDDFDPIDSLMRKLSRNESSRYEFFKNNNGYLFYSIFEAILENVHGQLDHISSVVESLEDRIFDGNEEKMLQQISRYWREAVDFQRALWLHSDMFPELKKEIKDMFDQETAGYIGIASNRHARLANHIENDISTLQILHETNDSLLSNKVNQIMKVLTIFAVIVFPLTLMSSMWGMNTQTVPFQDHPFGFWIVLGIMGLGTLMMVIAFKIKHWI